MSVLGFRGFRVEGGWGSECASALRPHASLGSGQFLLVLDLPGACRGSEAVSALGFRGFGWKVVAVSALGFRVRLQGGCGSEAARQ